MKYSKEILEVAVKESISYLGVLRALNISLSSGSARARIVKEINELNIDTSHFLGLKANSGPRHKGGVPKSTSPSKCCTKCLQVKERSEFYIRRKSRAGEHYAVCRDCMRKRGQSYYHKNRERQAYLANLRKKRYIKISKTYVSLVKKDVPCIDCGKIYPSFVMDFDHRDPKAKVASVSNFANHSSSNFEKLKQEIQKCDLVCSNCHRVRTYNRTHAAVAKVVKASA